MFKARTSLKHQLRPCKSLIWYDDGQEIARAPLSCVGIFVGVKSEHIHRYGRLEIFITCLDLLPQLLVHQEEKGQEIKEKASSFLNFKTEFLSRFVCVSYSRQALFLHRFREATNRSMRLLAEPTPGVLRTTEYLKGLRTHEVNTKNEEFQAEEQPFSATGYFLPQKEFTMSVDIPGCSG